MMALCDMMQLLAAILEVSNLCPVFNREIIIYSKITEQYVLTIKDKRRCCPPCVYSAVQYIDEQNCVYPGNPCNSKRVTDALIRGVKQTFKPHVRCKLNRIRKQGTNM